MPREFKYVSSSHIRGVAYDQEKSTLHVEFTNGGQYTYHEIPPDEYQALIEAPSVGEYFANNIKGAYSYTRE